MYKHKLLDGRMFGTPGLRHACHMLGFDMTDKHVGVYILERYFNLAPVSYALPSLPCGSQQARCCISTSAMQQASQLTTRRDIISAARRLQDWLACT